MTTQSGVRRYRFRPGPGRVVLLELPPDQEYHVPGGGRLWIPSALDHGARTCTVLVEAEPYIMDGQAFEPRYRKDSIVILGKFTGTIVTLDRTAHIICRESDVITELVPVESPSGEAQSET